MTAPSRMKIVAAAADDARRALLDAIGDISTVEVFNNQILVAIFIRPEKTAGGLFLPGQTRDEDKWQGKVGLVLKTGPMAFENDASHDFNGLTVQPGEWVIYSHADGWSLNVHDVPCRMLQDVHIKGRIANPTEVF